MAMNWLGQAAMTLGNDLYKNGMNAFGNYINGFVNEFFTDRARQKNYEVNEKAAKEADKRQRKQYKDLYSPEAMLQQYRAAGLSPSMMLSGGAPAVGGTAQGNMGSGGGNGYPSTGQVNTANPFFAAELENIKADTEGKKTDNALKEIRKNMEEITAARMQTEYDFLSTYFNKDGKKYSFADYAKNFNDFDDFKKNIFEQNLGDQKEKWLKTEIGENFLRSVFNATHELNNDIAVLSSSKMSAMVMEKVSRLLYNSDYAEQNKEAVLKQLKEIEEGSELTATQKGAFNNLIEKLGDGTFKDIVIVLLMALSNFQKGSMKLNFGGQTTYAGEK